jgi:stage II sporulation protein AA (anti-sigma F factor antagonist)
MERFSVETAVTDGRVLVTVAGEVDLAAADSLRSELEQHISGADTVVVDCAGITFIDSTGLRTLIEAAQRAKEAGTRFRLAAVPAPVARVFNLAGVTELFAIHADQTEALAD